jgi:hypothetical protein
MTAKAIRNVTGCPAATEMPVATRVKKRSIAAVTRAQRECAACLRHGR